MRWLSRRRSRPYDPALDARGVQVPPATPDRRGAILGALSGVAAEVERLRWPWPRRAPAEWREVAIPEADILFAAEDVGRRVTLGGEQYRVVSVPSQPTIMGKPKL